MKKLCFWTVDPIHDSPFNEHKYVCEVQDWKFESGVYLSSGETLSDVMKKHIEYRMDDIIAEKISPSSHEPHA